MKVQLSLILLLAFLERGVSGFVTRLQNSDIITLIPSSTTTSCCPSSPSPPSSTSLQAIKNLRGGAFRIRGGGFLKPAEEKVEIAMHSNNFLRGKLILIVHKLLVSPKIYAQIFVEKILPNTYWPEVVLILLNYNALYISRYLFALRPSKWFVEGEDRDLAYKKSTQKKVAQVLSKFGRLQALLYISDIIFVFLRLLKFEFVDSSKAQTIAGPVITAAWLAFNISKLKLYLLITGFGLKRKLQPPPRQVNASGEVEQPAEVDVKPEKLVVGYNRFANSILDVVIWGVAFISIIESLGMKVNIALKSIFGIGSFGTLVLSLASKDLAAEFVGGLMIQASNFFEEGESVVLQDKTEGKVVKIGWLHTYIDQGGLIIRVPNSQISHQRIARQRRKGGRSKFIQY